MESGVLFQGFDRLETYCEGKMDQEIYNRLLELRDEARDKEKEMFHEEMGAVVHPYGAGQVFQIRLSMLDGDMSLKLGKFKKPVKLRTVQTVRQGDLYKVGEVETGYKVEYRAKLDIYGSICRAMEPENLIKTANSILDVLFTERQEAKITRMDLCKDVAFSFSKEDEAGLVSRSNNREFCRADRARFQGDSFTGFIIGKAPIMLRIYNKTEELKKKKQLESYPKSYEKGVWRVEYQVRKVGKTMECKLNDLTERLADIWSYLTKEWTRLTSPFTTKNGRLARKSRWSVDPRWRKVQGYSSFGKTKFAVCRKRRYSAPADSLVQQALGCLEKAVILDSLATGTKPTKDSVLRTVWARLMGKDDDMFFIPPGFQEDKVWEQKIETKARKLCLTLQGQSRPVSLPVIGEIRELLNPT